MKNNFLDDLNGWAITKGDSPWLVEDWKSGKLEVTWSQASHEVQAVAAWLQHHYAGKNQNNVGLLSKNCAHWIMADLAIMASSNVTIPLFTTMPKDNFAYVMDFTQVETLFLGNAANWEIISHTLPAGSTVVRLPGAPAVEGDYNVLEWQQVVSEGMKLASAPSPDSSQLGTIIFTSGTTGKPKGVMHTMNTLREGGVHCSEIVRATSDCRVLSYLPLAHIGERNMVESVALVSGAQIFFNEEVPTFLEDMRNARPTWMMGVPRIWENLQNGVHAFAEAEGLDEASDEFRDQAREFLGMGAMRYILTSTAPTSKALKLWYQNLGLPLYDGYGQSELVAISGNLIDNHKQDSVGLQASGVEIKIAETGEILARGSLGALGYYKNPEATAETFDKDGWIHTGDKGHLDDDNHLYITGRLKEIFKTGKGKYVTPAPIEGQFVDHPLIDQACLTGAGLPRTVMLTVLSPAANDMSVDDINKILSAQLEKTNAQFEKHMAIGAVVTCCEPWSIANNMMTHTMKLKRDIVENSFQPWIDKAGVLLKQSSKELFVLHR